MEHFEALYPENSRFNEIEKILSFIKEGNSVQLVSLPGVGRSNLFGLLSYNTKVRIKHLSENQKWFHFVYLNFSEVKGKSAADVTKFIFIGLLDSLRDRKKNEEYEVVNQIFKESIEYNDELVLFQGFKKTIDYLSIEKELTVIFLFDRFETYIPSVTSEFFTNLRILRNRAKYRFSAVFSLNKTFEDTLERELLADFYEFVEGHVVYLPLLDKPGLDFRISYLEKAKNKKIDKKTLDEIINLTGGHGKLTRLSIEGVLGSEKPKVSSEFLLNHKPVEGAFLEIWNALNPSEQNILASDIKPQSPSTYLESVGLLENGKIQIPLFEEFIKQYQSKKPKEDILFDPNTNEIKKGEAVLSDSLTSSEFKLLKFFLQNRNRIIERNEIVENVWQDTKSIAGVTDQALDQLIFRSRKKIEDDPNNPTHLQTVKGRGFRFTA